MFYGCSNLKSIDKIDVKKVGNKGFTSMFFNCKSLVNIPSILPATELANYCYSQMFICHSSEISNLQFQNQSQCYYNHEEHSYYQQNQALVSYP